MIKSYAETFATKFLIAVINFVVVAFTVKYMGVSARGEISIFIANITILILFSNLLGGSAIAFYNNKINNAYLVVVSIIGVLIINLIGLVVFKIFEYGLIFHLFFLSILGGIYNSLQMLLIGKENTRMYNFSLLLPPLFLVVCLAFFYFSIGSVSIKLYLFGLYIANFASICFVFFNVKHQFIKFYFATEKKSLKKTISFSFKSGISNVLQFFNYRLSFYILFYFSGNASVGLLSVIIAVVEGIWIICNSISVNLYSKLLNEKNIFTKQQLTKKAFRLSIWLSAAAAIFILLIPNSFYIFIFGKELDQPKIYFLLLTPGIIFIAFSKVIEHYFSSNGILSVNFIKSVIGLICTLVFSFIFIKYAGIKGACVAYTVTYFFIFIWYFYKYNQVNKLRARDFILQKSDFQIE